MPDTTPAAYVVMLSALPRAAALILALAQADALVRETRYSASDEYRWDEYRAGEVWRLMSRRGGRGRWSWTGYAVHAVPQVRVGEASR